jgi:hypothetical protein
MKICLALLLLISKPSLAQVWEMEIMTGLAGYKGDLTERLLSLNSMGPSLGCNIRYNFDNTFILRGGITWGQVQASDKFNKRQDLKDRNLNFRTDILEANICAELNLFEPFFFKGYPYIFGGVGVFHFNPYTYDKESNRTYLQPLGTEGQGLAAYPDRKPYALTQICLPFGGGMKWNITDKFDIVYEISGRYLFTDYFDDVSKTYVTRQALMANSRPKAAELAYRQKNIPFPNEGDIRGNPKIKDWYYITGFKLLMRLGKN